jgi:hypothetical protein
MLPPPETAKEIFRKKIPRHTIRSNVARTKRIAVSVDSVLREMGSSQVDVSIIFAGQTRRLRSRLTCRRALADEGLSLSPLSLRRKNYAIAPVERVSNDLFSKHLAPGIAETYPNMF